MRQAIHLTADSTDKFLIDKNYNHGRPNVKVFLGPGVSLTLLQLEDAERLYEQIGHAVAHMRTTRDAWGTTWSPSRIPFRSI